MGPQIRGLAFALALVGSLLVHQEARAWVETQIKGDQITITLDAAGKATVQHRLLLRVRGGPLTRYSLDGVDEDAVPRPDATVVLARSGQAAGQPLPLGVELAGQSLVLMPEHKKGLASGTYLFEFSYDSDFRGRGLIKPGTDAAKLGWIGPMLSDGLDSALLTFRLPAGSKPPVIDPAVDADDHFDGVFLSTLRRTAALDELEIVRPHVARGEPVYWRILAAPEFAPSQQATAAPASEAAAPAPLSREPHPVRRDLLLMAIGALFFGALMLAKHLAVRRACAKRSIPMRPLIRMSAWLRAGLSAALVMVSGATVLWSPFPLLAALPALLGMALGVFLSPHWTRPLRGPGQWQEVNLRKVLGDTPKPAPVGRLLDAGTVPGFTLFLMLFSGVLYLAASVFERSPLRGVSLALATVFLFPLFLTGRGAELPLDMLRYACRFSLSMTKKLGPSVKASVRTIGRFPSGQTLPDEVRLELVPARSLAGVLAVEVALEHFHGTGGSLAQPVVLVRVQDGSEAYHAFPRSVVWLRGREADERALVLRPKLPSRAVTIQLLSEVFSVLSPVPGTERRSKSSGKPSLASKLLTTRSPSQAT